MCGWITFNFLAQVCCRFVWQTKSAFPELILSPSPSPSPVSRGVFFVCSPCLLTLWQPESSWIVWKECLFVLPTCCHCGFDCLSRQPGLRHSHSRTLTHSHPCGWTFLLAGLPDGAAGSLWPAAIRRSDWLCFLIGWATWRRHVKVGGTLHWFLSRWGFKLLGKKVLNRSWSLWKLCKNLRGSYILKDFI